MLAETHEKHFVPAMYVLGPTCSGFTRRRSARDARRTGPGGRALTIVLQTLARHLVFEATPFALSDVDELPSMCVSAEFKTAAILAEMTTVRFRDPAVSRERRQSCSRRWRRWRSPPDR
jgi:hypothetical protein